jgi:hypothetical protein
LHAFTRKALFSTVDSVSFLPFHEPMFPVKLLSPAHCPPTPPYTTTRLDPALPCWDLAALSASAPPPLPAAPGSLTALLHQALEAAPSAGSEDCAAGAQSACAALRKCSAGSMG